MDELILILYEALALLLFILNYEVPVGNLITVASIESSDCYIRCYQGMIQLKIVNFSESSRYSNRDCFAFLLAFRAIEVFSSRCVFLEPSLYHWFIYQILDQNQLSTFQPHSGKSNNVSSFYRSNGFRQHLTNYMHMRHEVNILMALPPKNRYEEVSSICQRFLHNDPINSFCCLIIV